MQWSNDFHTYVVVVLHINFFRKIILKIQYLVTTKKIERSMDIVHFYLHICKDIIRQI
jgi:hypothetical protein